MTANDNTSRLTSGLRSRTLCLFAAALSGGICGCSSAVSGGFAQSPGPTGSTPRPADLLDLSHWELNLPVDAAGNPSGTAATIPAAQLVAGYRSQWFDTASDNGVIFMVPASGATTPSATSPRSELREQIAPPSDDVNWSASGTSHLDATVAVLKVPASSGKLIIGQIHGNDSEPMLKLLFVADGLGSYTVIAEYRLSPNGGPSFVDYPLATSVTLGQRFTYRVSVIAGTLSMSVDGGSSATRLIGAAWLGETYYFKAGAYGSSSGLAGDDAAAEFYALSASHS